MQILLRSLSLTLLVQFGLADPSVAQSLGFSIAGDGRLAAGVTDQVKGADLFFFGDATARLSHENSPIGFELGIFGLANIVDTPHETYGTFTLDFAQGGKLLLGVTRPAYDSFAVSAMEKSLPALGVSHTASTRSLATYGAMFAGYLPYGLRFESASGSLRYAVSIATVPNRDTTIASAGFSMPIGDLTLESAIEAAHAATTKVAGKVQLSGDFGQVHAGLGYYSPSTVGRPDMVEAFASFDPFDKLTVAGVIQIPLTNADDPVVGVSARYALTAAVGLSAGVLRDGQAGNAYSTQVDWNF